MPHPPRLRLMALDELTPYPDGSVPADTEDGKPFAPKAGRSQRFASLGNHVRVSTTSLPIPIPMGRTF